MKAVSCRIFSVVTGALMFLGATCAAHAVVIDFNSEIPGSRPNGFAPNSGVTFSDSIGADMQIGDFGVQSDGLGLAVFSDTDGSGLYIDFAFDITSISLAFGNDDPNFTVPGDVALLRVFHGGSTIDEILVPLVADDIMNQTIEFSGHSIDRVFFAYANSSLVPSTGTQSSLVSSTGTSARPGLIEVVDNINFTVSPVPLPAALPLFLAALSALGFWGWRRRRMA